MESKILKGLLLAELADLFKALSLTQFLLEVSFPVVFP